MTVSDTHLGEQLQTLTAYNLAGQPTSVGSALLSDPAHPRLSLICSTAYDSHGRPTDATLNFAGRTFNLGSTAYDRLGRTASVTAEGDITRTFAYDLHGWLTAWSCGTLSQSLAYASGTTPSYTGRISQKTTISPNRKNTYDYFYDSMGRLIEARSSGFDNNGLGSFGLSRKTDHSTAYSYDLNGNMLTLKRKGAVAFGLYGQIDDVTATYCGNQIATIRDDAADVLLESSLDMPHGQWSGSDFAYDRNGNQTRDLSRGVADIVYNELNLPARVEMDGGGSIEYLYTAAGSKLAEIIRDQEGVLLNRRDYVGMFEFESDSLRAIALASGFVSAADTTFHLYVHDYQGNVTGVYNTRSGALEQFTDFYPYGLPHAMTRSGDKSTNRRLYSAKELTTDHGLNTFDFEARSLTPAFPRFTTKDRLSEKYLNISPYCYTASDPINYMDLSGDSIMTTMHVPGADGENSITLTYSMGEQNFIDSNGNPYQGGDEKVDGLLSTLNALCSKPNGKGFVSKLANGESNVLIITKKSSRGRDDKGTNGNHEFPSEDKRYSSMIHFNWGAEPTYGGNLLTMLIHELGHSFDRINGTIDMGIWIPSEFTENRRSISYSELYSTHFENLVRREHNLPLRTHYNINPDGSMDDISRILDSQNRSLYFDRINNRISHSKLTPSKRYQY